MKTTYKLVLLVMAFIGMSACSVAADRPNTKPGKPGDTGETKYIPELSEATTEELGGRELAFVAAVRADGSIQLFRPPHTKTKKFDLPQNVSSITKIQPITIIGYTASPQCLVWVEGGVGGGGGYDGFCALWE